MLSSSQLRERWLKTVSQTVIVPQTFNLWVENSFAVVLCGECKEPIRSPFSGDSWWERWHLLVRRWITCRRCGVRQKVNRGYQQYVPDIGALPSEEEEVW